MESEREVKSLAAVWALRAILTPEGFEDFNLDEGEVYWRKENLKKVVAFLGESQTPNVLKLLSSNSLKSVNRGLHSIALTRKGHFFVNLRKLEKLLHLSEAEREVLLFALLATEENGLREAVHEAHFDGPSEFFSHLSRILKISSGEIRKALRKDGTLCSGGLVQFDRGRRYSGIEPLPGLYDALFKPGAEVADLLAGYFSKSPPPALHLKEFSHHPDLEVLIGYLQTALKTGEPGNNVLIHGPPGTGKTELARSLAHHLGAPLFEVSTEDEDGNPVEEDQRFRSYLLCQRVVAKNPGSLILFDEIEDVFPSPSPFSWGAEKFQQAQRLDQQGAGNQPDPDYLGLQPPRRHGLGGNPEVRPHYRGSRCPQFGPGKECSGKCWKGWRLGGFHPGACGKCQPRPGTHGKGGKGRGYCHRGIPKPLKMF